MNLQQALLTGTQIDPGRVFLVANDKAKNQDGHVRLGTVVAMKSVRESHHNDASRPADRRPRSVHKTSAPASPMHISC